jgi:hypothetical protein
MKFATEADRELAAGFIQNLLAVGVRVEAEVLGDTIEIRIG